MPSICLHHKLGAALRETNFLMTEIIKSIAALIIPSIQGQVYEEQPVKNEG